MKKNMGVTDRILRLLLAAVFTYLYFVGIVTGTLGLLLVVFSGIFIITSLFGVCPLYSVFGLSTCPHKK